MTKPKPITPVDPDVSLVLALKYRPVFYQKVDTAYDLIQSINFGEFIADSGKPTIYYAAREDAANYYIHYSVFHYKDVAGNFEPNIRPFTHRGDFEGVQLYISKETLMITHAVSRFHYELKCWKLSKRIYPIEFQIQANGHGIYHDNFHRDYLYYHDYNLDNMLDPKHKKGWEKVAKIFKEWGVDMPVMWNDAHISDKFGVKQTAGLYWNNPALFMELAEKSLIVKEW